MIYNKKIIHYAVAIPEGEGRYVLHRLTGNVRIEHGPSMFLPDPREEVVVRRILSDTEATLLYPGNAEAFQHNRLLRQSSQVNANDVPMASMSLAEDIDTTYRDAHISARLRAGGGGLISPLAGGTAAPKGMPVAAQISNMSYASTVSSAESAAQALVGGTTQRKSSNTPPRTITLDTKYDGVVSVDVWTGYAALLVRKNGERRVVVGPQTVLLEYDERPMMLELSTGTPKTDVNKLRTGFLRILNNSVSDQVLVETSDSFQATIVLRYHLNFTGDNPEVWFNVENYVQFLAERTRSMIRRAAKKHTVRDIRDNAIDIVRTLILGAPVDGSSRPGRVFSENGMTIFDLDVETPIIQGDIDRLLRQTEQETLRRSLELDQRERDLAHQSRMEEIDRELQLATATTAELRGDLTLRELGRALAEQVAVVTNVERVQEARLAHRVDQQLQLDTIAAAELSREVAQQQADITTTRAQAETVVYEVKEKAAAITPHLIDVLERLGEEEFMARLATAMAPMSILGGQTIVEVLRGFLGNGNPAGDTLATFTKFQVNIGTNQTNQLVA